MNKAQQIAAIVIAANGQAVQYKQIAAQMGVSVQSVTGAVAALKKDPTFTFVAGGIAAKVAQAAVAVHEKKPRTNTKQAKANGVLAEFFAKKSFARKDLIAALMTDANLSKNGANTYIQNYKIRNGLIGKK